jgi:sulfite dehydrogenase (cytochrome) subunit B
MRPLPLVCVVILLAAGVTVARADDITLPPDHPFGMLKPGAGSEVAQRGCVLCHSTDYIVTQPPGDQKQWDGVVTKMIKVYGAPLSEPDARTIVEYLARQYGK